MPPKDVVLPASIKPQSPTMIEFASVGPGPRTDRIADVKAETVLLAIVEFVMNSPPGLSLKIPPAVIEELLLTVEFEIVKLA